MILDASTRLDNGQTDPGSADTLCMTLARHARETPDKLLYRFLVSDEETDDVSFGTFYRDSLATAAVLASRAKPGERVALLYAPGRDYITAFVACLLVGAIAVPCYPSSNARQAERTRKRLSDSGAVLALTGRGESEALRELLDCPDWLETGGNFVSDGPPFAPAPARPGDVAFIQYTSGSTSDPKGVVIDHANLVANARTTNDAYAFDADSVVVTWLPPYHDMGLIGCMLQPIFSGFTSVVMAPTAFIQRPVRWLDAITRFGGTHSGGPNFAFQLCIDRISEEQKRTLDLGTLRIAFCGSEPIRADTMERFAEAFAGCGLRRGAVVPCYGMAEATLLAACAEPDTGALVIETKGDDGRIRRLVSSGRPVIEALRIVDPQTCGALGEGEVGEIWLSGPQVAHVYWNKPDISRERLAATLADDEVEARYLRTGDLGFLRDGQLFVSGRIKDVIILNGQNIYPQDVEAAAFHSVPGARVDGAAAFGRDDGQGEELVVVQELKRGAKPSDAILRAIAANVFDRVGVQPDDIVLTTQSAIPRTSSGKIRRSQCRADLASGALRCLGRWRRGLVQADADSRDDHEPAARPPLDAAAVERWLVETLARRLGIPAADIDPEQPFAGYGVTSLMAAEVSDALARFVGTSLAATVLWDFPSPAHLARHLAGPRTAEVELVPSDIARAEAPADEPIAIVGLGCRFPQADGIEAFWSLLCEGKDAIRQVPAERLAAGTYRVSPEGPLHARFAGFLDRIEEFDAPFFGIAPAEAAHMDPQQRLLLEASWRALEHAGIAPASLAGTQTSVFVGISNRDYADRLNARPQRTIYDSTGNALSIAANRLSYLLDLRGPSIAVDTACSASIVAVHMACQSLRRGESSLALVGGVNLILSDVSSAPFIHAGLLSTDGRCRAFDAGANGYVRGEGVGAVVLKRLSDAERDGDPIRAVVLGSAVGQDGRSNGLTAPSGQAQEAVIRQALSASGLAAGDIGYIEAHGTGTRLGDPIEFNALGAVLADCGAEADPCLLGSVKTNIGHLEPAAGIASLIKVALMMEREAVPPHLNLQSLNPECRTGRARFAIPQTLRRWTGPRRFAGISSFGYGGTLAHAIVGAAPPRASRAAAAPCQVIALSAKTERALDKASRSLAAMLRQNAGIGAPDVAHALNLGRNTFKHRRAVVASDRASLISQLDTATQTPAARVDRVLFVFPGQGAQRHAMGRELYETVRPFRERLDHCAQVFAAALGADLRDLLYGDGGNPSLVDRTEYTQPLLFAVSHASAGLWLDLGLRPEGLIGHSLGEYNAACLAGVFDFDEALALVALRGRLMQALPPGAMLAVEMSEADVGPQLQAGLCLAAVNGPRRCVISGPTAAVDKLERTLIEREVALRRLPVSHAFHSGMMEPITEAYREALGRTKLSAPSIPFVSNVTGRWITPAQATSPDYWIEHLLRPVRFHDGIGALAEKVDLSTVVMEVGPSGGLASLMLRGGHLPSGSTVLRGFTSESVGSDRKSILSVVARLWAGGQAIDWSRLHDGPRPSLSLPGHPLEPVRCWLDQPDPFQEAHAPMPLPTDASWEPTMHGTSGLNASNGGREQRLLGELTTMVATLLELTASDIDPDASLLELGADSVGMIHAVRQIEQSYGLRLSIQQLFEELTSLRRIAAYLDCHAAPDPVPSAATPPASVPAMSPIQPAPLSSATPLSESMLANIFSRQLDVMSQQVALLSGHATALPVLPQAARLAQPVIAPKPQLFPPHEGAGPALAPLASPSPLRAFTLWQGQAGRAAAGGQPEPLGREELPRLRLSLSFFGLYDSAFSADKYDLLFKAAAFAERNGFEALWLPERHFHAFGGLSPNPSVLAAALARETKTIALRAGSVVLPLHSPIRVAEEWSVVDNLSHGRVGIAAASGWHANDFAIAPDAYESRQALTFERLDLIRSLWRGEPHRTLDGAGQPMDVMLFPMPAQKDLPVWITVVSNPETYRRAGEIGAGVLTNLMGQSIDELARNLAIYRDARCDAGHAGTGHVTVLLHTHLRENAQDARDEARAPFKAYLASSIGLFQNLLRSLGMDPAMETLSEQDRDYLLDTAFDRYVGQSALIGSPKSCEAILNRLREAGVSECAAFIDFGVPTDRVLAALPALGVLKDRVEADTAPPAGGIDAPVAGSGRLGEDRIVLSWGQQRLWTLAQIRGADDVSYNIPAAIDLEGSLDAAALAEAIAAVVARHAPLRTIIEGVEGVPRGRLLSATSPEAVLVLEEWPDLDEAALDAVISEEAARSFDQQSQSPFRARLLRLRPDRHVLLLTWHHGAADGMSLSLFGAEMSAAYSGRGGGGTPRIAEPRVSYADIAAWQRDYFARSDAFATMLDYWRRELSDAPHVLELPTKTPRTADRSRATGAIAVDLPAALVTKLASQAKGMGATVFATLLAAYAATLSRLARQDDVVIGVAGSGRSRIEAEKLIGFFVTTLPLRLKVDTAQAVADLVRQANTKTLSALTNQDLPFERLIDELKVTRSLAQAPLVQAIISWQSKAALGDALNNIATTLNLPGLNASVLPTRPAQIAFDLVLDLTPTQDGAIRGSLQFDASLFDEAFIAGLVGSFERVLESIAERPGQPVGEIDLLSPEDRYKLLVEWNDTAHLVPNATLPELFDLQTAITPDRVAVVFEGESLSYAALHARAGEMARYLTARGIGPEDLVALCLPRSIAMVVSLLGILKAGAAYLPIDPDYPGERVAFMLADAQPQAIVTTQILAGADLWEGTTVPRLVVSDLGVLDGEPPKSPSDGHRNVPLTLSHPAYVIYTSGSTGRPKGVVVTHEGIVNRILWMQDRYRLSRNDRVLQKTPFTFDVSVWEFFWPLTQGSTLVVARPDGHKDPAYLARTLDEQQITTVHFVPPMLDEFLSLDAPLALSNLRRVICSGQSLMGSTVERFFARIEGAELHNLYGPTEASIDVTSWACRPGEVEAAVPIGRPIWNTRLYVLDSGLQPVRVGVPGNLYLAGTGLARGYLNRPELTAERFVDCPFEPDGARMYRTGDLARWRSDGALEFLGRNDAQVKLRGFRIELGEVEAALARQTGIVQAVVQLREDQPGRQQLIGYVVAERDLRVDPGALRGALKRVLPDYMVPAMIVQIDKIPLSSNGKVDHRSLPAPKVASVGGRGAETPSEQFVATAFVELLKVPSVSAEDNFFELGGNSMDAMRLVARVRGNLGVDLPLKDFFASPTVVLTAEKIDVLAWLAQQEAAGTPDMSDRDIGYI